MSLEQLNKRQRAAVKYIDSPLLVLAGAGSGKTRVITQKIAYLIEECGLKAHNIAAVTFTNKASKEMKVRVSQILDKSKSKGLKVSTFHTLGLNILKKEYKHADLRSGFSIFDTDLEIGERKKRARQFSFFKTKCKDIPKKYQGENYNYFKILTPRGNECFLFDGIGMCAQPHNQRRERCLKYWSPL